MAITASFTYTTQTGTAPFIVTFTDTSTGSPSPNSWSWDFGDGTTSTLQNPSHTYTTPGTFSPSLTVNNANSEWDVCAKPGLIGVSRSGNPVANPFISHVTNGNFESWSGGVPTGWTLKTGYTGQAQSSDHKVGTSSLQISGNTATQYRGWIWQSVAAGENYTKAACFIKITGLTQGTLNIVLWDGTTETVKQFSHNCDWRWIEWRIPYSTAYSDAEIDIYTSGYLNTGANVYIDGLVFSKDYELATSETEGSTTLSKTITYNPGAVYSNATIVIKYDILDIPCYETGTTTCTVDSVSRACTFLPSGQGGQTYIDISSLSNASHTIVITTPYNRVGRYTRNGVLTWKGYTWTARSGQGAPQFNRWNPNGIYVDYLDRLHLTIKNVNGIWYSSEADNDIDYRYGKYTWTVDQEALNLDKNTVVGLFTYQTDTNEHDIEFSKWENETANNVWFSNQPRPVYNTALYPSEKVLCSIDWQPESCRYTMVTESGTTIADYTDNDAVPTTVAESIAMNLWLWGAPSNLSEIDITIYDFSYEVYVPYREWTNREISITVENPSATDGVQVRMKIYSRTGMEADGKDFRFTDIDGTDIPFYIDTVYNSYYIVWIKLPANETQILFYYGNSSATSVSSAANTFDFVDAWDTIDYSKWTLSTYGNGAAAASDGKVWITASAGYAKLESIATFNYPVKINHVLIVDNVNTNSRHRFNHPLTFDVGLFDGQVFWMDEEGTGVDAPYTVGTFYTIYQIWEPGVLYDFQLLRYPQDYEVHSQSTDVSVSSGASAITLSVGDPNSTTKHGDMKVYLTFVTKYVAVEPSLKFSYPEWANQDNKIYVNHPSSTDGVQGKVQLAFLEGMNSDGSDIRFTDVWGNILTYYLESFEDNIFTFWVKLRADHFVVYYHYGNTAVTSLSSGTSTFELYDNFASLNSALWDVSGSYTISNSELSMSSVASNAPNFKSKSAFAVGHIAEGRIKSSAIRNRGSYFLGFRETLTNANNVGALLYGRVGADNAMYLYNANGGTYTQIEPLTPTILNYHTYTLKWAASLDSAISDGWDLGTNTTNVYTGNCYLYLNGGDAGTGSTTTWDWVRVRKYVSPEPVLYPVYDLKKLDPESIDITSTINDVCMQLSAKFPTANIPPKNSRVIYFATASDATNLLLFYGRVVSNTKSLSYLGNDTVMIAADDRIALTNQKIRPAISAYCFEKLTDWYNEQMTYQTDFSLGMYSDVTMPAKWVSFDYGSSKWDAHKKALDYFGCIRRPQFVLNEPACVPPNIAITTVIPEDMDSDARYAPPYPITFTWPSSAIVDMPTVEKEIDETYNKVTVYGTIRSTGAETIATVCTKGVIDDPQTADEYVINMNDLEEKSTTAQTEATKLLLYFQSNRATVKMRLMNMAGIGLYQRIKFGSGFPTELTELTDQEQFEYVCVLNVATGSHYQSYTVVDVSGVPRPEWLRVSDIKYHTEDTGQYIDVTLVTDFIYSKTDTAVLAPYNAYLNIGMMKPTAGDAATQISTIVNKVIINNPVPEYGTITAISANGYTATILTKSGRYVTGTYAFPMDQSNVGKDVLVTPNGKGTYYIST